MSTAQLRSAAARQVTATRVAIAILCLIITSTSSLISARHCRIQEGWLFTRIDDQNQLYIGASRREGYPSCMDAAGNLSPLCVVSRQRAYLAILSALPPKAVTQEALEAGSAWRLCARSGHSIILGFTPELRFGYFRFRLLASTQAKLISFQYSFFRRCSSSRVYFPRPLSFPRFLGSFASRVSTSNASSPTFLPSPQPDSFCSANWFFMDSNSPVE